MKPAAYPSIEMTIGNTPLVRLQRIAGDGNARRGNVVLKTPNPQDFDAAAQPGQPVQPGQPAPAPTGAPPVPGQTAQPVTAAVTRAAAIATSTRVPIATASLQGSIALNGGRIDDLALVKFRETVDPKSPPIVLLSPSGTA